MKNYVPGTYGVIFKNCRKFYSTFFSEVFHSQKENIDWISITNYIWSFFLIVIAKINLFINVKNAANFKEISFPSSLKDENNKSKEVRDRFLNGFLMG